MAHDLSPASALAVGIALAACGPSETGGSGTTAGTTRAMLGTSSEGYDGSESTVAGTTSSECSTVHEGDLIIRADTDVDALADVGRATGSVSIAQTDFTDLQFLSCLREIGSSLDIYANEQLVSLAGLEALHSVEDISIGANVNLADLSAPSQVTELRELRIGLIGTTNLGFSGLERLERLLIGTECLDPREYPPPESPSRLTEIEGLANLESIGLAAVHGQTELTSLGRLHEIAAAGGLAYAGFYNNLELPYAEIEQLEAEAGLDFDACGNLDDPEPSCRESDQFPSVCIAP